MFGPIITSRIPHPNIVTIASRRNAIMLFDHSYDKTYFEKIDDSYHKFIKMKDI